MALYAGRNWTRTELLSRIGDPAQIAGARPSVLSHGKAEGVRAIEVETGSGFSFTVLPGRGMDIPFALYKGKSLTFFSGTGITAPGYFEEPGFGWLRSFFVGLLTTCGITNAGAPSVDQGKAFGLHGRLSNAAAEDLAIDQEWDGDDFVIRLKGAVREASAMGENMGLTRRIETRLGARGFHLQDTIVNKGFEPQPLMMLYHFNFGFPLLSARTKIVGPVTSSTPRDPEAAKDKGVEECLSWCEPVQAYKEKVFFHTLAADRQGRTFIGLANPDAGDGAPLGIVLRWNQKELPFFTEWKMPARGFYVLGLEPGTIMPIGRGALRDQGTLPLIDGQESRTISIDFEVLETHAELSALEKEARTK